MLDCLLFCESPSWPGTASRLLLLGFFFLFFYDPASSPSSSSTNRLSFLLSLLFYWKLATNSFNSASVNASSQFLSYLIFNTRGQRRVYREGYWSDTYSSPALISRTTDLDTSRMYTSGRSLIEGTHLPYKEGGKRASYLYQLFLSCYLSFVSSSIEYPVPTFVNGYIKQLFTGSFLSRCLMTPHRNTVI